ncbi:unnamed protein product [Thelazia callipaeda]|uniref:MYND-type domain-containing protein n=1 Tax=Thelazia callipaeda TaxID=103827 RepID=A0A0N5CVQ2_THECL|nr:unnamed protein product [Thelazia callipaeda]
MNGDKKYGSILQRTCHFEQPFAYICLNNQLHQYCSYCLRKPDSKKLYKCSKCELSRYCNKECQRSAWKDHKAECRRLQAVYPNLPLSEVLFLSRIIDKVLFLEENGDKFGWQKCREWKALMGHEDDIRSDELKYAHFEKIYGKMALYRKEEMISKEKFYQIFCKTTINSHAIHTSIGWETGIALDLGVSKYDHSCRPNCSLVFDGFYACLRSLTPEINASDPSKAHISYIDVGRSRYHRQKELKEKWYFDCRCERCTDPMDDVLTSICCTNKNCDEPLLITENSEISDILCPKCEHITPENHVKMCQELMLSLPVQFLTETDPNEIQLKLNEALRYLHPKNVYVTRLRAALLHFNGSVQDNLLFVQKSVYENYRLCFPRSDRHVAFQLLHIVKSYIEKGERQEASLPSFIVTQTVLYTFTLDAVSYAYDAMCIFEVCFGLNHPYYLQTLALWTFLDQSIPKSDQELFALMNFQFSKPIDLTPFLLKKLNK